MAVLDTVSAHSLSHTDKLLEICNFILYFFSNLLKVSDTFSSEQGDGFTKSSEGVINSLFELLGIELLKIIMPPRFF
jgi:hypothetical protein